MEKTKRIEKTVSEIIIDAQEEISRLIKEGVTSGVLSDGYGGHVSWSLTVTAWKD